MGYDWEDRLYFVSEYFQQLYEWGERADCKGQGLRLPTFRRRDARLSRHADRARRDSPYRERSVEENLDLFARMKAGEFPDGECVLRAKIDIKSISLSEKKSIY